MKLTIFTREQSSRVLIVLMVLLPSWFGVWTMRGEGGSSQRQLRFGSEASSRYHLALGGGCAARDQALRASCVPTRYREMVLTAGLVAEPTFAQLQGRKQKKATAKKPKIDYTKFSHQTHVVSQKLACDSCHKVPAKNWNVVRTGDAAFHDVSDFPEHASCLGCHREQFFARERPAPSICSNCHIAVTPRDTARWLFPSLGDLKDPKLKRREFVSEFVVGFPHDKHIDVVGSLQRNGPGFLTVSFQEKKTPASCPVCHATYQPQGNSNDEYVTKPPKDIGDNFWLKKGTFKTIPNSHTACFTCHNADSGVAPEPKNCNVCHKLLTPENKLPADFDQTLPMKMGITDRYILLRWPQRVSAGAFRHEAGLHTEISCLNCHNAGNTSFNTTKPSTLKVPVKSCGGEEGCHITQTLDDGGSLNYELDQRKKDPKFVCTKCHITFGSLPAPEGHAKALPTPKPKVNPGE